MDNYHDGKYIVIFTNKDVLNKQWFHTKKDAEKYVINSKIIQKYYKKKSEQKEQIEKFKETGQFVVPNKISVLLVDLYKGSR